MGLFENADYERGTMEMARIVTNVPAAYTVVGGGDSVRALRKSGEAAKVDHVSTGGGPFWSLSSRGGFCRGIQALKFGLEL